MKCEATKRFTAEDRETTENFSTIKAQKHK
jgi:hypothetical protein